MMGGGVSECYTFEVYNAAGEQIYTQSTSADRTISNGCNYLLSVCTYSDVNNPITHYYFRETDNLHSSICPRSTPKE